MINVLVRDFQMSADLLQHPLFVNTLAATLAYIFTFVVARSIKWTFLRCRRSFSPLPPACPTPFDYSNFPALLKKQDIPAVPETPPEPSFDDLLKALEEKRGTKILFDRLESSLGDFIHYFPLQNRHYPVRRRKLRKYPSETPPRHKH